MKYIGIYRKAAMIYVEWTAFSIFNKNVTPNVIHTSASANDVMQIVRLLRQIFAFHPDEKQWVFELQITWLPEIEIHWYFFVQLKNHDSYNAFLLFRNVTPQICHCDITHYSYEMTKNFLLAYAYCSIEERYCFDCKVSQRSFYKLETLFVFEQEQFDSRCFFYIVDY